MKRQTIILLFAYKHIIEYFSDFYTPKASYYPDDLFKIWTFAQFVKILSSFSAFGDGSQSM